MNIDPRERSIYELFDGITIYRIPDYQRDFAWSTDEIDDFWSDVVGAGDKEHFLGPMVFHDDGGREDTYWVIDGQQRLTVSQLLLGVIRDKYISLGDLDRDGASTRSSEESQRLIQPANYKGSRQKFLPGDQHAFIFENFVVPIRGATNRRLFDNSEDWKNVPHAARKRNESLRKAWKLLSERLDQYLEGQASDPTAAHRKLWALEAGFFENVKVMALIVKDLEDAYILFETLNDRGLGLSAADLLKSHILREMKAKKLSQQEQNLAQQRWDGLVDQLDGRDVSGFLRHYLLTQIEDRRVKKDRVFGEFKKQVTSRGPKEVLEDVIAYGQHYSTLVSPKKASPEFEGALSAVRGPGVASQRVLLVQGLITLPAREFLKLCSLVEVLSFRWTVTGGNAQELETLFQKLANDLRTAGRDGLEQVLDALRIAAPSDNSFRSQMRTHAPGTEVAAYALRKIEVALTSSEKSVASRSSVHVEHIMPRAPGDHWGTKVNDRDEYDEVVRRWGNLTLLDARLNKSIQNAAWLTKRDGSKKPRAKADPSKTKPRGGATGVLECYRDSQLALTQQLLTIDDWNENQIQQRGEWIAQVATQIWSMSDHKRLPAYIPLSADGTQRKLPTVDRPRTRKSR